MTENDQKTRAIAKPRHSQRFRSSGKANDEGKPAASRYTFFIIGLVSLFAGSWAVTCLVKAATNVGPLSLLQQLSSALIGR